MVKAIKLFFLIVLSVFLFSYSQNNLISVTRFELSFKNLPDGFDGYKIIHLSDLHGKIFPVDNSTPVNIIKKTGPDIIVVTGDLIDARNYNEEESIDFLHKVSRIAPVYYITGNHEFSVSGFDSLERKIKDMGINVLRNSVSELKNVRIFRQRYYQRGI